MEIVLESKAKEIRRTVLDMIAKANKGHIGGSFSCVEILVTLYYSNFLQTGKLILSKGHACPTLYAILADLGYFDKTLLDTFCVEGSILEGHPNRKIPGVVASTGSLGHGLSIGAGMALAGKDNIFVILGDGECQEGSVWEAANFAAQHKLSNLLAIVDNNNQGVLDYISENLGDKFSAFGWNVERCDGHSFNELIETLEIAQVKSQHFNEPSVIIARTVKGKGISFMEHNLEYHHRVPAGKELELARVELGH